MQHFPTIYNNNHNNQLPQFHTKIPHKFTPSISKIILKKAITKAKSHYLPKGRTRSTARGSRGATNGYHSTPFLRFCDNDSQARKCSIIPSQLLDHIAINLANATSGPKHFPSRFFPNLLTPRHFGKSRPIGARGARKGRGRVLRRGGFGEKRS